MPSKDQTEKKTVEMHQDTLSLVRGNTLPWHEDYLRYFQSRAIIERWIRQVRARKYQSSEHAQATLTRYMFIDTRDLFVDMCNRSNKYQLILIQHLLCIAQKEPDLSRSFLWSLILSAYYSQALNYLEEYVLAGKNQQFIPFGYAGKIHFDPHPALQQSDNPFAVIVIEKLRQQFSNICSASSPNTFDANLLCPPEDPKRRLSSEILIEVTKRHERREETERRQEAEREKRRLSLPEL